MSAEENLKVKELNLPNSFCVAPWIHAYVGATGSRGLCCVSDEAPAEVARLKYSEFKNSEYLKKIRRSMLAGSLPKECRLCETPNRINTYKDDLNLIYEHKIEQIINSTQEDGFSDIPLNYLDYRSNLCNLKCRTCGPNSSSSIQKQLNLQNQYLVKVLFSPFVGVDDKKVTQYFSSNYVPEMLELASHQDIDRIYFAGGEPVIEPNHIPFLEKLVESGRSAQVALAYNTNLSYHSKIFNKWVSLIEKFKSVEVYVSVDGPDKVCEYIREGLNFETLKSNLSHLISEHSFSVVLDITITSLNLFFLEKFALFAIEKNIKVVSKLMLHGEYSFPLLRADSIPQEQKKLLIERWDIFYKNLIPESQNLLSNLNNTVYLFSLRSQDLSYSVADYLFRLRLYESMYPENNKFIDLLQDDSIGAQWAQFLRKQCT